MTPKESRLVFVYYYVINNGYIHVCLGVFQSQVIFFFLNRMPGYETISHYKAVYNSIFQQVVKRDKTAIAITSKNYYYYYDIS